MRMEEIFQKRNYPLLEKRVKELREIKASPNFPQEVQDTEQELDEFRHLLSLAFQLKEVPE